MSSLMEFGMEEEEAKEISRLQRACLKGYRDYCMREAVQRTAAEHESTDAELQELRRRCEERALYPVEASLAAYSARRRAVRAVAECAVRHSEWEKAQRLRIAELRRVGAKEMTASQRRELQERESAQLADRATRLSHRVTQMGRAMCGLAEEPLGDPPCFNSVVIVHCGGLKPERYAKAMASHLELNFATVTATIVERPADDYSSPRSRWAKLCEDVFGRVTDAVNDCGILVERSGMAASTTDAEEDWPGVRPVLAGCVEEVARARHVNDANVLILGVSKVREQEACGMAEVLLSTATGPPSAT
eukprot:TRINITY_DN36499_c0_g1_i1.p1 TRINITY_DN36499_c0_g1~~TRINITY_DN36499_c0_g1_i1.p1  ORF type:complete len:305 (+),score=116.90 TRINITY_DN36499_c0_g1_i1:52-966(+)